jgi:hypothetical protein
MTTVPIGVITYQSYTELIHIINTRTIHTPSSITQLIKHRFHFITKINVTLNCISINLQTLSSNYTIYDAKENNWLKTIELCQPNYVCNKT